MIWVGIEGSPCPVGMPEGRPPQLLWALLPSCHFCATMAVQRGYTILIVPLSTALSSLEALRFFFWLKRMQELERERDALLQGLEMVDHVRDWFQRHLLEAQRRQKHMGAEAAYFPDPYSNQSCLLLAKIQEVNLCLKNLLTPPGKAEFPPRAFGVPLYPAGKKEFHHQAVTVLKEQNHLLIKEVSEKSDRIAQLEQEKAALCKQLKESRGYRPPSHKESTFI
uniref:Suppressor APC domain containing 1 n=1 Tax=Salvator merianae TaxID=96440 RepID=A0A8D0DKP0_SALMN